MPLARRAAGRRSGSAWSELTRRGPGKRRREVSVPNENALEEKFLFIARPLLDKVVSMITHAGAGVTTSKFPSSAFGTNPEGSSHEQVHRDCARRDMHHGRTLVPDVWSGPRASSCPHGPAAAVRGESGNCLRADLV